MKHGAAAVLKPEQESYLDRLLPPRDALLGDMEALARREQIPIADPEVGRLLGILARASGARRILEIGTAIGYGTLCLARSSPEARVVSIDIDEKRLERARGFFARAGVADRIELLLGDALALLPDLAGPFDFAWIDAVKTDYRRYLDLVLPKLRVGGLVACDNLLWAGRVAVPQDDEEEATAALRAFNGYLMMHPQLQAIVLPVGDGVGLAVKTKPLRSELGGPL